jgi:hypothetical protein
MNSKCNEWKWGLVYFTNFTYKIIRDLSPENGNDVEIILQCSRSQIMYETFCGAVIPVDYNSMFLLFKID